VGGLFSWLIVPRLAAWLTIPHFAEMISGASAFVFWWTYVWGESKLGNGASSWILHMAFIILVANGWGFALREWAGVSRKTRFTIITGVALIILSVALVGYGNAIK
jgi:L-rhamnose-H+ transport protein